MITHSKFRIFYLYAGTKRSKENIFNEILANALRIDSGVYRMLKGEDAASIFRQNEEIQNYLEKISQIYFLEIFPSLSVMKDIVQISYLL